jgi:hypothetical protein
MSSASGAQSGSSWRSTFPILADEAADATTRAAAARILSASEDKKVRVRVAAATEEIGDASMRRRIATATMPDAEAAAAEMDAIELEELREISGA